MSISKRIQKSIRTKFLLLILSATILIFLITLTIISFDFRKDSLNNAYTLTDSYSREYAKEVKAYLEEYMDVARSIKSVFEGKDHYPIECRRDNFMTILHDILESNKHFLAAWTIWEPNSVDGEDSLHILKPGCTYIGSFSATYYRMNGKVYLENSGVDGELFVGSYYTIPKKTKEESLLNPFYYSYTGKDKDAILQTNMIIPIVINRVFHGVIGIDAALEEFEVIINKIHPFNNGHSFILANDGSFIAHPDKSNIGIFFNDYSNQIEKQHNVINKVKEGEPFSFTWKDPSTNEKFYYSFTPIYVGNATTPWALAVVVPYKSILSNANKIISFAAIIVILGLLALALLLNFLISKISNPLVKISEEMKKLNAADVDKLDNIAQDENNEIGSIATASHQLIDWINKTGEFAVNIGSGNYDYEYNLFNENDLLGKSLKDMSDTLKLAQEESVKREKENEKKTWASQGEANLNEIVRKNNDNMENLYYLILSELVNYIDANQGGIFIIEKDGDEEILELKSTYAYNRRKYLKKKLEFKDGLVGQCALEREIIHLNEVPEDYLEITSGLGASSPRNILLIPLIFNEKIFGVIEIASFNKFEDYVINFIKHVGETIASTISIVKTNIQTTSLLDKSQQQAEELEVGEHELQQNLEELKAVHEKMEEVNKEVEKREKNVIAILDGIPDGLLTCNENGKIVDFNPEFLRYTGYVSEDLAKKDISILIKDKNFKTLELLKEHEIPIVKKDGITVKTKIKLNIIEKTNQKNFIFLVRTN